MIDDEIIEVVQARKAGMRIQFFSQIMKDWLPATTPTWNFVEIRYRVHPADLPAWERIKGERLAELNYKVNHPKVMPAPDLPPLPEGAVLLPKKYVMPDGETLFDGWILGDEGWEGFTKDFIGPDHLARYAVKPDTEIARINGVGWGECPSPHGWHNPHNLTPEEVKVPHFRLLCRDEIGRREESFCYGQWNKAENDWDACQAYLLFPSATYNTSAPYGSLPPVIEHTFPECAPTKPNPNAMPGDWHQADLNKPDKGYGQDLDGKPLSPPSDRHEIIPVNTKVHPGEVTHFYFVGDHTAKWRSFLTDGPPTPIKENDGTSQVYEEDGNYILAYARLRYSVLHERSGIKPGDVVEVVRLAEHHERGWNHISPRIPQQSYVGHMGEVIEDCGSDDGFEIRFSDNYLMLAPAFVLRKVERVRVPLEASDWAGGPWTIFDTIANNTQLQELVIGVDKNGRIETKLDDYLPEEMKENCKRARGWPGDNLTFEGCWKWADESER